MFFVDHMLPFGALFLVLSFHPLYLEGLFANILTCRYLPNIRDRFYRKARSWLAHNQIKILPLNILQVPLLTNLLNS